MANLTKRAVDAAMAAEKQTILWDDKLKGFGLLVLPSGTKSFIVQFRSEAGRSRRLTIGRYGAFTPDQARTEASEILLSVAKGGDPMAEKRSARAAPTVDDLLDRYIREHVKRHNGPTTQAEIERLVAKHLRLRLGALKVAAVTNGDIAKLHRAMGETPRQANHVLSIISKMFNLAEVWGMRPRNNNPVFGIKRYAEAERERFLTADELGRLGATLAEAENKGLPWAVKAKGSKHLPPDAEDRRTAVNPKAIAAIRLLLFTGARLSEILTLRWDDVDLPEGMLSLPDRKGGRRRPHPINAAAQAILAALPRFKGSPWVLPRETDSSRHLSKEVTENAWRRVRTHARIEDVRLHDLRHTVGTFAGQAGVNAFVVRDLLRHRGVAMTGRYVNTAADPVRAVSDIVGERISAALDGVSRGTEVVTLHDRKPR